MLLFQIFEILENQSTWPHSGGEKEPLLIIQYLDKMRVSLLIFPGSLFKNIIRISHCRTFLIVCAILTSCRGDPVVGGGADSSQEYSSQECPINVPSGACRAGANRNEAAKSSLNDLERPPQLECHVFMAPSTLGEETNLGIYTGKPLKEGDVVNYPELVVPLLFREWGKHPDRFGKDAKLWDRYIWEGILMDLETYEDTDREASRAAFVPGVGCTVNSVLDMNNINSTRGSQFDTAGLSRTRDPGSGAFSPYHSSRTVVVRNISEGTELLAKYGDYWIPEVAGAQVTFRHLMIDAEDFLQDEYIPFVEQNLNFSETLKSALWQFTADFPVYSQTMTNLPRSHQWKDVEEMYNRNKAEAKSDKTSYRSNKDKLHPAHSVVQSFLQQQQIRPLSWLYENGYCQDHLVPGRSTIEQAGRGAFAARKLPKGAVVGYAPLVHIGFYGRDMWTIEYNNVGGVPGVRRQYDLIINYSFGHPNSTVILTPYGGIVNYINHNSQSPNVRVRWPQKELVAHKPDWLKRDPLFLRDTFNKVGLSFEYIALRDIEEGEEVFMDYGPDWEEAWNRHVEQWEPLPNAHEYVSAEDIREPYLRTIHEVFENPYPPNIGTLCLPSYTGINAASTEGGNVNQRPVYRWLPPRMKDPKYIPQRHYCIIVERHGPSRNDGNYTYTVDIKIGEVEGASSWIRVMNVTSEGVALYNLAFTNDWHMPNVFRHLIGIPDDVMPETWLNGPIQSPI